MKTLNNNIYPQHGPWIATIFVVISGHFEIIFYEPLRFLAGLISPIIMAGMLLFTLVAMLFGYLIGILPALLTGHLFNKIINKNLPNATQFQFLATGFMVSLIWLIPICILVLNQPYLWKIALAMVSIISITSILCAEISWEHYCRSIKI